ncbi:MAG: hypothetical protein HY975_02550 [Candidatus Kerfeldbacteria bacterium]|nr:hypothetical protein [Candidatus Kerfeldbacteria bacterium]
MNTTRLRLLACLPQLVLLGIELRTSYDTWPRQVALSLTNVAGLVAVLTFDRWLRRRGSRLSWVTVILTFGSIWLDALGNFQHLYAGYWWWDRITHTVGGMAISGGFIDFFQSWRRTGQLTVTWGFATLTGFLVGQLLGSLYEISEWLGDAWFGTNRVVYRYDTPHDLFFNILGGLLVVLLARLTRSR